MCKLLRRITCLLVVSAVAFVVIALIEGGDPFRRVGREAERAGKFIHEKSDQLAERADRLGMTKKKLKEQARKAEKIKKEITGE